MEREQEQTSEIELRFHILKCGNSGGPGEWRYKMFWAAAI